MVGVVSTVTTVDVTSGTVDVAVGTVVVETIVGPWVVVGEVVSNTVDGGPGSVEVGVGP